MCYDQRLMTSTQRKHRFELDRQRRQTDVFLAFAQVYGAAASADTQDAAPLESMASMLKAANESRTKEVQTEELISELLEIEASHSR